MSSRRARGLALAVAVAAVAATGGLLVVSPSAHRAPTTGQAVPPPGVSRVELRDLVSHAHLTGSLAYSDRRPLAAARGGTLTMTPRAGSVIRQAGELYRLDDSPTVLLYGPVPAWRSLAIGTRGVDVRQLEEDLRALGFAPGPADGVFDRDTATAVRRWKASVGLARSETLSDSDVVFLPGPRRVGTVYAALGARVRQGAKVFETSSTEQVAEIRLPVGQRALVHRHGVAEIGLPDGRTIEGTVGSIGTVARHTAADQAAYVTVELDLGPQGAGGLDAAPVEVDLVAGVERHVLSVPVTALLARRGGEYCLDAIVSGRHRLLPVRLGSFAGGYVAVSGRGIERGLVVTVAQ